MTTTKTPTIDTRDRRCATQFQYPVLALALMSVWPSRLLAQDRHSRTATPLQKSEQSALLVIIRNATARFKDVSEAEHEGYRLEFGCVSGRDSGAMGLHYVNGYLVNEGILDARRPQVVIYEPTSEGRKKLIGADFLLFADKWNEKHSSSPELMGKPLHLIDAPNRFGLPALYTLRVWG